MHVTECSSAPITISQILFGAGPELNESVYCCPACLATAFPYQTQPPKMNGTKPNGHHASKMNGTKTNGTNTNGHDASHSQALLPEIVQKLKQDVDILSDFYSTNAHAGPSFDQHAPIASVPNNAPLEVKNASDAVMDSALKLFDLVSGPTKILSHLTVAVSTSRHLHTGYKKKSS